MVLVYKYEHRYNFSFRTASLAYFNKYPNPFSKHVVSADTISRTIDSDGKLRIDRLIRKQGRLPQFIRPFLKSVTDTWVLETSVVDPHTATLTSWTRNLDHTRLLRVEDWTEFSASGLDDPNTSVRSRLSFRSNFNKWGLKDRIESWSYRESEARIKWSLEGLSFVMEQFRAKGWQAYTQAQHLERFELV